MALQTRLLTLLVALLFSVTLVGWSYPTISGDSGLVLVPTADVMPLMNLELAFDYNRFEVGTSSATAFPVRLNYGIIPNIELFGVYADANDNHGYDVKGGGMKVQLVKGTGAEFSPSLAVGAHMLRFDNAIERNVETAYLVSSASLYNQENYPRDGYQVRAHLGVEFNRFSGDLADNDFFTPFIGASFESVGGSSFVVDYLPRLDSGSTVYRQSSLSAAVRLPISNILVLQIGGGRPFGVGDTSLSAGIMYHYGEGKSVENDPLSDYLPPVTEY